jgi:adenylosuccinate synthase
MQRSQVPNLRITMADLWNGPARLKGKLEEICGKWAKFRTGTPIEKADEMIAAFLGGCEKFAAVVHPAGIGQCKDPVFEGAQGLLLSQDNTAMAPHLTHSYTGMRNVRELCQSAGIDKLDLYYVSRTYLTRHGAGPLPGEDAALTYADDTNMPHSYQGVLRFATLDYDALMQRCSTDAGATPFRLVLTHCDQEAPKVAAEVRSFGPTRHDVERVS